MTDAGGTVTYAYDAANNLASLTEPGGHQTSFTNDSDDWRTSTIFPNGVSETRTFSADRLTGITAVRGTTTLEDFRYCYRNPATGCDQSPQTGAPTDQIQRATERTAGNSTAYGYDALERLTGATVTGTNPASYAYAYDAAGNRTSQSVNGVGTTCAYNAANQKTQAGTTTFSYDANGNHLSSSTGLILAYNAKNQTTSITPPGGSASAQTYAGAGQLDRASSGGTSFTRSALGLGVQSAGGGSSYFTRDDRVASSASGPRPGPATTT